MTNVVSGRYGCPGCGKVSAVVRVDHEHVRFWCHGRPDERQGDAVVGCPSVTERIVYKLADLRVAQPPRRSPFDDAAEPTALSRRSSKPSALPPAGFTWPTSPQDDLDESDRRLLAELVELREVHPHWYSTNYVAWADLVAHGLVVVRDEVESRPGAVFEVTPSPRAAKYLSRHRAKKKAQQPEDEVPQP